MRVWGYHLLVGSEGAGKTLCVLEELQIQAPGLWGGQGGDEPPGLHGEVGSKDRQLDEGWEGAGCCWAHTAAARILGLYGPAAFCAPHLLNLQN